MKGTSLAIGVDLQSLVSQTKLNYLEIGCYDGWNLRMLGENFQNKTIYGIDPFISDGHVPGDKGNPLNQQKINLYENISNIKNVSFHETTSELFFRNPPSKFEDMNISCIFVDGAHIFDIVKIDSELAVECILKNEHKKGEIVFHDLHIPDVVQAIEYFKEYSVKNSLDVFEWKPGHFRVELV